MLRGLDRAGAGHIHVNAVNNRRLNVTVSGMPPSGVPEALARSGGA